MQAVELTRTSGLRWAILGFALGLLCLTGTTAHAELYQAVYTGTIDYVGFELSGAFSEGQAVSGVILFDSEADGTGQGSDFATYYAILRWEARFGSLDYQIQSASPLTHPVIRIANGFDPGLGASGDTWRARNVSTSAPVIGPPVGGRQPTVLHLRLRDPSGTALSSTDLDVPIDLADFSDSDIYLEFELDELPTQVFATITTFEIDPAPSIPIGSWPGMVALCIGVMGVTRLNAMRGRLRGPASG